ncbi:DNA-processing protein DprA [Amycolatopsis sp. lyj-112]|uniref:DNA-processing protein DprA n=1 Tax=Amycolatopsis sp. lyj-112 TaxID=2789288 RepID=UPI00397B6BF0
MTTDEAQRAFAYLLASAEPPAPLTVAFVADVGAVEAVRRIAAAEAPAPVLQEHRPGDHWSTVDRVLATARLIHARLVTPLDDDWPTARLTTPPRHSGTAPRVAPPLALWVRGHRRLAALTDPAVSIVGARAATAYGEHTATELARDLSTRGVTVWSSAALGIDGAALRGALATSTPTVAVLAGGIDIGYPAAHATLLETITESGLVVSEYNPGTPPSRHRFLQRSRVLAAFTAAVIVVEAGRYSGALNTAADAASLGRPVLAIPGPVTSSLSTGPHTLIRTGRARLVTCADDVTAAVPELAPAGSHDSPDRPQHEH